MTNLIGNRAGQKLGNYQLKRLIGQGGFAEVYLAEHVYLKTQAAVKVLQTQLAREDQESFLNEARTIARLKHPHILSVLEFGVEQGTAFLIMDYAPHGSLRDRYQKHTLLKPITVLPHLKQAAAALQYAHQQNIIHRDIKPENLLLGPGDETLLSDFGMALGTRSSRTQSMDDIAGTVAYMAPELLQGRPVPASDQYALGIVLYEWLSGDCPFRGSFTEVASQHLLAQPPAIKAPAVSPEVEAVILQALAKQPEQRFESVQAFADAFERATLEVGSTFRARTGWLPPGVYPQLQTVPSIELQATLPESSQPTQVQQPTLRSDTSLAPTKIVQRLKDRKSPSRGFTIIIAVLALIVAISGISYLAFHSGQPGIVSQVPTAAQATAAATSWQNRYEQVVNNPPFFVDSLNQNVNGWDTGNDGTISCLFGNNAYHVSALLPYKLAGCTPKKFGSFNNLAYQVQMTIVRGDEGGIIFRLISPTAKQQQQNYFFTLNRSGTYTLWAVHAQYKILLHKPSPAIKTGLNQSNLLIVIAQGKQIVLYINKQYVASILDNSSARGTIGLFATSLPDTTEVVFSDLKVWRL